VAVASFLCNGVIFGIINSYGVLFVYLQKEDDADAATKASLVGSLAIGMTFLLSPISSILVEKFGIRRTAFTGGFIAFLGMLLSAFVVEHVRWHS
jgi:MCP family monocarboxylic acid transporter-like MFS transporter 10